MTRIAIIAALPKELIPLVKGWSDQSANGVTIWSHREDASEWIAACAGMGVDAATRACTEVMKQGRLEAVFSIGWAGALQDGLTPGQAYRVAGVVDDQTGERIRTVDTAADLWLVTVPRIVGQAEKSRLASVHRAALVDMEGIGVARFAAKHDLPFYCLKGISDGPHERLPDFNAFVSADQRFRLIPFIFFAFLRPWLWPALMRLGAYSQRAARDLRELVLVTLRERKTSTPPAHSRPKI